MTGSVKEKRAAALRAIEDAFAAFPNVRAKMLLEAYTYPCSTKGVEALLTWLSGISVPEEVAERSTSGADIQALKQYVKIHDLDSTYVDRLTERIAEAYHYAMTSPDAVVTFEPYSVEP